MGSTNRLARILKALDAYYGIDNVCYLNYKQEYELLIATILSAQCTDARVNQVTDKLFKRYTCLQDFASVDLNELEEAIHSTGFFRNKAKNIKKTASQLLIQHGGVLPKTIEAMTDLPGVGRKTANVVLGHIYGIPGIIVDTHVKRISAKLGITEEKDPVKIEFDLMTKIPKDHWLRYNTQIIAHGRTICKARKPECDACFLLPDCPTGQQR